ncbi:MAG: hypothetical protein J3K34DRAFT_29555 [Monoraphidium minutum]|nr:MAG: hypothetical protein J3K34DRAFT_29555 [Monoraphidium minutum]
MCLVLSSFVCCSCSRLKSFSSRPQASDFPPSATAGSVDSTAPTALSPLLLGPPAVNKPCPSISLVHPPQPKVQEQAKQSRGGYCRTTAQLVLITRVQYWGAPCNLQSGRLQATWAPPGGVPRCSLKPAQATSRHKRKLQAARTQRLVPISLFRPGLPGQTAASQRAPPAGGPPPGKHPQTDQREQRRAAATAVAKERRAPVAGAGAGGA